MRFNLWEDCNRVPLTELLSFIVDNRGKTVPTAPSGHKLIATNCVTNNTLFPVYEKIRYLSEETYQTWFRAHPIPGDILFVNKGTPGRVCLVPDPVDFCIAQDMIALRADESKIYPKYLFAVLRSREIQQQIYNTNVGDVRSYIVVEGNDQRFLSSRTGNEERVLRYIDSCGNVTLKQISLGVKLSQATTSRIVKNLVKDRRVRITNNGRVQVYSLAVINTNTR